MKLEIAESLALSYLKHFKKCVFYQNNWKPSNQWDKSNVTDVKMLFGRVQKHFRVRGVCKWTSKCGQFLKQAEIDAIGLDTLGVVYAIDTAFHEYGLKYGSSPEQAAERILKKLFRAYLILKTYFPQNKYEIIFASPKAAPRLKTLVEEMIKELQEVINDDSVKFDCFFNDDFKVKFMNPTLKVSVRNSDTAELFLRAIRLYELWEPRDKIQKSPRAKAIQAVESGAVPTVSESLDGFWEFYPADEKLFKEKLLEVKRAKRTWIYADGRQVQDTWNARNMTLESNLRGNIASNNKVRVRGELGLVKLIIEIEE